MRRILSSIVATIALLTASAAFAHGGHAHKVVMGTVRAIDAKHIDLKTTKGTMQRVPLASDTMFMRGSGMAKISDVKPGTRVVIELSANGKAEHVKLPRKK